MKEDPPNTILLTRKQAAMEAEQEKLDDEDTANSGVDRTRSILLKISCLEEILFTFTGVINPIPGRVHLLQHSINTRDSPPLRIAPHRLLLKWKDQLYTEVKDLLEAGIHQTVHGFPSN